MLIPSIITPGKTSDNEIIDFMGAKIKKLTTQGERSATGMDSERGVLVVEVKAGTEASVFFQANDVILSFNNKPSTICMICWRRECQLLEPIQRRLFFVIRKKLKKELNWREKNENVIQLNKPFK